MEDKVIRLLEEKGLLPVYRIAKELRTTYGAAQYYIELLTRHGKVYTVKVGARRYVALNGQDWLNAVTVEDVIEELSIMLRRAKIKPKTPLSEALKMLEHKAHNVAEALMLIVATLRHQTSP